MDVRCSPAGGFTHHQRGNAAIVLFERQYMERVEAHDSLIFSPHDCSLSILRLCRLELFILHKEKMLRDTRTFKMERA